MIFVYIPQFVVLRGRKLKGVYDEVGSDSGFTPALGVICTPPLQVTLPVPEHTYFTYYTAPTRKYVRVYAHSMTNRMNLILLNMKS